MRVDEEVEWIFNEWDDISQAYQNDILDTLCSIANAGNAKEALAEKVRLARLVERARAEAEGRR